MLNQFKNLSCYEEFEIQCTLNGISKIDILKEIGYKIDDYYFFISEDGIFNWFDLNENHIKDPRILKDIKEDYISQTITKCIIPNSATSIDKWAFSFCRSLTSITIPNSVTNIGNGAFLYCESLKSITLPNNITRIGNDAFSCCKSLTSITVPDNVTSVGINVFYKCKSLKEVIFKGKTLDEVKRMKNYPFGIEDESIIDCEINDFSQYIN